MPNSCAIYCRVSTEKQKERHTIESQKRILPALAAARGWQIYKMYVDDGVSGEALRHMPALRQLLNDAESGLFAYVLIIDIDRFTRFARDSERALIVDICLEQNVKIVTPDHIYNLANRNDRLQFNIKGTVSLYEKETIRERCIRGIREKRLQGRWTGGTPPIPYTYNHGKKCLEIDEQKLTDLKKMLSLAPDHSARDIARTIPDYTPRMIRRILEPNRLLFYTGCQQVEKKVVQGLWPAIITEDEKDRILAAKKKRNARGGKSTQAKHLLTGLGILRCGYCGRTLKAWTDRKTRKNGKLYSRTYYRCTSIHDVKGPCKKSRMIPAERLEDKVLTNIKKTMADTQGLTAAFKAANNSKPETVDHVRGIRQKIEKEKAGKSRLISAIENGVIEFGEAKDRILEINQVISNSEKQIQTLENEHRTWTPDAIENLQKLPVQSTNFHEARMIITTCLAKINVYSNSAYLNYHFPVMASGSFIKRLRF